MVISQFKTPDQNALYDFLLNRLHTAMNVLVQIYDSQTIICKKKLLNIQKNILRLTRVHSHSGKQQRLFNTHCYCFANSRTTSTR